MGDLEFARPVALYGLALVLPVALLHLYRKRRRRRSVAFVPLLREASAPVRSFGGFARVAERVRLLARLAALGALVLAAAGVRPAARASSSPVDVVLVVDADVTQQTNEDDPSATLVERRFERSIALATSHALSRGEGRVALVVAGASPRTVVAPTTDGGAVVRALDALEPGAGTADLAAAIAAARTLARPDREARIVVVTARALPPGCEDVVVATAGRASLDVGFVDAAVAALPGGLKTRARFVIRNFDAAARRVHVVVRWDGDPDGSAAEERDLDLGPAAEADAFFDVLPPRGGGVLRATLSGEGGARDAFAGNDVAALAIASGARPSVLVVHRGGPRPFVRALLDALGDAIDREGSGFVEAASLASATPRDLVVYDGTGSIAGAPAAPAIYLAPFPRDARLPFRLGRTLVEPLVWRATEDHPLLRGVDLSTAYVATATTIHGEGVVGLAFVEGEAVLAEGGPSGARFVALGLDPDASDLPVRAALPILLKNAIRRLSVIPASPLPPFVRAGTPVGVRSAIGGPWRLEFAGRDPYPLSKRAHRRRAAAGDGPPAERAGAVPEGRPAPIDVPTLSPDVLGPLAPAGGPFVVTLRDPVSGAERAGTRTVSLDLDRRREIRPARPESARPAPIPPRPEGVESRWGRILLAIAGGLLVLDAALGARTRARTRVAPRGHGKPT